MFIEQQKENYFLNVLKEKERKSSKISKGKLILKKFLIEVEKKFSMMK